MATLQELQERLDALKDARATGVARVEIGDRVVQYRSDADLVAAIRDLETEIAGDTKPPVNLVYVNATKGL